MASGAVRWFKSDHHECGFQDEYLGRKLQLGKRKPVAKAGPAAIRSQAVVFSASCNESADEMFVKIRQCGIWRGVASLLTRSACAHIDLGRTAITAVT